MTKKTTKLAPVVRGTQRCMGRTKRRSDNQDKRCLHTTTHGSFCHQHMKKKYGLRVAKSDLGGQRMGLYAATEKGLPKGYKIDFTGDEYINRDTKFNPPYGMQIKKKPPTYLIARRTLEPGLGRWANSCEGQCTDNAKFVYDNEKDQAYLETLRDINDKEEITFPHNKWGKYRMFYAPNIKELRSKVVVKKRKVPEPVIEDEYSGFIPELDPSDQFYKQSLSKPEPIAPRHRKRIIEYNYPNDNLPEEPKIKKIRKARKPVPKKSKKQLGQLRQERNIDNIIKRLKKIELIMNNKSWAIEAGLKQRAKPLKINIPVQGKQGILDYTLKLEKILKAQEQALYEYLKNGAKKKYTKLQTIELLDKMAKKKR